MSTTGKRSLQTVHRIRSGRKTARCKCAPAEQTPQIQERRRFTADIRREAAHGKKPLKFDGDEVKKQRAEEKENYFDYDSQGGNASVGSDDVKTVKARTTDPEADLCTEKAYAFTHTEKG